MSSGENVECNFLIGKNSLNNDVDDIVSPDSTDLDWAQITYALNCDRIIFVNNHEAWSNFNTINEYKCIDYTPEELSHRFLQRVLPNIYDYELTEDELHILHLLDLHPHFVKTNNGYKLEQMESLCFPSNEAAIECFMSQMGSLCEADFVAGNQQIQIVNPSNNSSFHRTFNFNAENAALISMVLSSDENLTSCELLNIKDIHTRLKAAKTMFENNGQHLENTNITLDDLLKKLNTLKKLKIAVAELVDRSFRK